VPEETTPEANLEASYNILKEEKDKDMTIAKANPQMFRELQYLVTCHPDVLNPRSEDLERAWATEEFDRMIIHPEVFDGKETGKLLLGANPTTKKNIDKYLAKEAPMGAMPTPMDINGGMPNAGNSPLNAMGKKPLQTKTLANIAGQ
jgi:hypothetical protein